MQDLEIFIFTFNRAESLRTTLSQLTAEPVRFCRITVLDNHSTDATPEVCATAKNSLANFRHIRHPKNIGGLANYLRGIELAEAKYTWVICDDDSLDFSKAADVFAEIAKGATDIISVGVEGHPLPPGERGTLRTFAQEHNFFLWHSFVPSMIFKTALFDADRIRAGYDNIDTMFPHFPFLVHIAETDRSIYVSREKVITKSNNVGYSTSRFMSGWLKSCRRFNSRKLRTKALSEVFSGENFFKTLIFSILIEREYRPERCKAEFRDLRAEAARTDRLIWLKILLATPLFFTPGFLHRILWNKFAQYRRNKGSELPNFDEVR
jgi:glycosyltransferase involved in cell wall biosynthesis